MNSKAHVTGKLGHVVKIHVLLFAVKVTLNHSIASFSRHSFKMKYGLFDLVRSNGH